MKELLEIIFIDSNDVFKKEFADIMKEGTKKTELDFLRELTRRVSKKYVMNLEVMQILPSNVNQLWDLSRKLKIYREFKAYLFNKEKKREEEKFLIRLEKPKRNKLIIKR